MLVDMFGNPLAVGQSVFYADAGVGPDGDDCPELGLYIIVELSEPNVITAESLNGQFAGEWFYLEDPVKRVAIIGGDTRLFIAANCYSDSTFH